MNNIRMPLNYWLPLTCSQCGKQEIGRLAFELLWQQRDVVHTCPIYSFARYVEPEFFCPTCAQRIAA